MLSDEQRRDPVPARWLAAVASRAAAALKIDAAGTLAISCVDRSTMCRLHRRFAGDASLTDVLTFRYDGEPVVGEILVSPEFAREYSRMHRVSYRHELARYVIHGLLHWVGYDDRTPSQRSQMRELENRLLANCGDIL